MIRDVCKCFLELFQDVDVVHHEIHILVQQHKLELYLYTKEIVQGTIEYYVMNNTKLSQQ